MVFAFIDRVLKQLDLVLIIERVVEKASVTEEKNTVKDASVIAVVKII